MIEETEYSKFAYRELRVLTEKDLNYKFNEALYATLRLIPETKELSKNLLKINNQDLFKAIQKAIELEQETEFNN